MNGPEFLSARNVDVTVFGGMGMLNDISFLKRKFGSSDTAVRSAERFFRFGLKDISKDLGFLPQ